MKTINDKTVSVIIPVFNSEKVLKTCIESVINQTYFHLEIILIDDGSNSLQICKEYSQKDNRIVVLHHDNHGVSYTRNRGLDIATGEYVMFVDADDYALPDMIEHYYQTAVSSNADIIIGGIKFVKNGEETIKFPPNEVYTTNTPIYYMAQGFRGIFGYVPNKMYLKSLITDNNIKFPEDYTVQEDLLFALSAYDLCNSVCQIQYAGYVYIMPEKEKEISFEALIKNKITLGEISNKRGIDITILKGSLNDILYGALFSADDLKVIKRYINENRIIDWIDYRLCKNKEKKYIIKAAVNHHYQRIFHYFKFRKKIVSILRR